MMKIFIQSGWVKYFIIIPICKGLTTFMSLKMKTHDVELPDVSQKIDRYNKLEKKNKGICRKPNLYMQNLKNQNGSFNWGE